MRGARAPTQTGPTPMALFLVPTRVCAGGERCEVFLLVTVCQTKWVAGTQISVNQADLKLLLVVVMCVQVASLQIFY